MRKGTTTPYLTHLLAVASLVGESGGSEAEVIAGLLHDAVEDGGGAPVLEEIRARFGPEVAAIVSSCTDDDSVGEKAPWLERKRAYLAHLVEAPIPVLRVVCADKLHNVQAIAKDLRNHGVVRVRAVPVRPGGNPVVLPEHRQAVRGADPGRAQPGPGPARPDP